MFKKSLASLISAALFAASPLTAAAQIMTRGVVPIVSGTPMIVTGLNSHVQTTLLLNMPTLTQSALVTTAALVPTVAQLAPTATLTPIAKTMAATSVAGSPLAVIQSNEKVDKILALNALFDSAAQQAAALTEEVVSPETRSKIQNIFYSLGSSEIHWHWTLPAGDRYIRVPLSRIKDADSEQYDALIPVGTDIPNSLTQDPNKAGYFILVRFGGQKGEVHYSGDISFYHDGWQYAAKSALATALIPAAKIMAAATQANEDSNMVGKNGPGNAGISHMESKYEVLKAAIAKRGVKAEVAMQSRRGGEGHYWFIVNILGVVEDFKSISDLFEQDAHGQWSYAGIATTIKVNGTPLDAPVVGSPLSAIQSGKVADNAPALTLLFDNASQKETSSAIAHGPQDATIRLIEQNRFQTPYYNVRHYLLGVVAGDPYLSSRLTEGQQAQLVTKLMDYSDRLGARELIAQFIFWISRSDRPSRL